MPAVAPCLAPIFRSETQLRVLAALYLEGGDWTLSELARRTQLELSRVSREVTRLEDAGIVTSVVRGRNRVVSARTDYSWSVPLRQLLDQTAGPVHHLADLLADQRWRSVHRAAIFGSWARRYLGEVGPPPNDLDVILVVDGILDLADVVAFERELAQRVGLSVDAFAVDLADWTDPQPDSAVALARAAGVVVLGAGGIVDEPAA